MRTWTEHEKCTLSMLLSLPTDVHVHVNVIVAVVGFAIATSIRQFSPSIPRTLLRKTICNSHISLGCSHISFIVCCRFLLFFSCFLFSSFECVLVIFLTHALSLHSHFGKSTNSNYHKFLTDLAVARHVFGVADHKQVKSGKIVWSAIRFNFATKKYSN